MIKRLLLSALLLLAYSYASAQPANDTCANAIALTVGTGVCNSIQYDNTGGTAEPSDPIPSCWVPASISHTTWFTFVPDSSRVHISTNFNYALSNTQVAVYSGTCGAFTEIACQEDIYSFNGFNHTDMIISGLTIGNTYYIMIDGNGAATGTYGICVENLGQPSAALAAEDCYTATYLCDTTMISVATNTNTSGSVAEQQFCFVVTNDPGAHWFQFTALTSGVLSFDIYANDGTTDYDWAVYDVTTGCPGFAIGCDYTASAGMVTGLGCGSIACQASLAIGGGSTYAILVSRRTANSTGFTLNFTTTTALFGGVPIPTFTHGDSVCVGQSLSFTNTSSTVNQNLSFVWNFGDGNTSTDASPSHAYAAAGTYNVTLISTCGSSSNVQTSSVTILPPLPATVTPTSATICNGDSVTLIGAATFNQSLLVPQSFTNPTDFPIPDFPTPGIQSDITVSGIIPNSFFANPVISVCLNIAHTFDGDLQVALRAPDGNQMYLILNQGGFGAGFTGTCFVPTGAPNIITGTAPFTGDWTPYENFSPAFDLTPINGTWSLLVTDVAGGDIGTLLDWTITFNTQNYLTYSWTPSTGLSSTTTDTTVAMPTVTTNYTFIATDATGCPGSASTLVNVTNTPQSTFSVNSNMLCIDEVATVTYTGVASGNATYTWNFGAATVISGSGAGPYLISWTGAASDSITLVVQDSSCTSLTTITYITVNPNPTVTTTGSDTLVCEGTSIDLFANSSGTATYSWTGPGGFNSTAQNPVIPGATSAMTGLYFVNAIDNGCPSNPGANVFVQVVPAPVSNAVSNSPVCDEGTIMLGTDTILGGTYSWVGPNSFTSTLVSPSITPAGFSSAGTYTVTTSVGGCTSPPSNVTVVINALPVAPVAGSTSPVCEGSSVDLFSDTIAGVSYLWTGPNGFSDPNQNTTRFGVTPSDGGDYLLVRIDLVTGCISHADTVNVQVDQIVFATFPEPILHTCSMDVQLIANDPNPGTGTWSLISGTGTPAPPATNFVNLAAGVDTGSSVFQWLVINGTCRDSSQLTVFHDGIDTCGTLSVNELITPNNDNLNERLIFTGLFQYPNNQLIIFNRWGSEVFSQNNYQNEWRGRTEVGTTGDELPDGTYYYVLTVPGQPAVKGFVEVRKK